MTRYACSWRCPRCARDLAFLAACAVGTGLAVTAAAAAVLVAASWAWRRDLTADLLHHLAPSGDPA